MTKKCFPNFGISLDGSDRGPRGSRSLQVGSQQYMQTLGARGGRGHILPELEGFEGFELVPARGAKLPTSAARYSLARAAGQCALA